jgi:hypothetical protein
MVLLILMLAMCTGGSGTFSCRTGEHHDDDLPRDHRGRIVVSF